MEDAYNYYDSIMDSDESPNIQEKFSFSRAEWTAFCQGAPLEVLANWRYDGWPSVCEKTGRQIDISQFGWMVVESNNSFSLIKL